MGDIVIEGRLTTVGPLSIRMPGDEGKDKDKHDGFPLMSRGVDEDGKPEKTGYLPATTLRGFLRRAVVIRAMRKAREDGAPYSLPRAYAELIGQDAESERQAGDIDLVEIQKARESSPVIDLFGSGLGVASRLRVGHFLPAGNVRPERYPGVRKDLGDTEGVVELLSEDDARRYYGREEANRQRVDAEKLVTSLKRKISQARKKGEDVAPLEAQLAEAEKLVEKYRARMGGMRNSSRSIVGYTALPVGLDLHGRIVILNARDRDLEMIEYALDCLSRRPVLGAQSARGCGEIEGVFDVRIEGEVKKTIMIGGYKPAIVDSF